MVGYVLAAALAVHAAAADGFLGIALMADENSGKPVVTEVVKDSPAEKAGIKADDVVEKYDGQAVLSVQDLIEKVRATKPGTEVTVTVKRGKDTKEIKVKVGTRPDDVDK
ncbi:MAG TPA: PDZ domain-containing protein [Gemmataceae bacterium]|nr:PDZ domain-containing protein [Gemmataceae bacterium]